MKMFFSKSLFLCISSSLLIIACNVTLDVYGVYGESCKRELNIWGEERFSKKLLSYRYIPECFDGVLIGPSLSANLNTQSISQKKIYNLSLMGARINHFESYLQPLLEPADRRVKTAMICLHPYLTETSPAPITPQKEAALGSVGLIRTYVLGLIRRFEIWSSKYPKSQYNTYGHNSYDSFFEVPDVAAHIQKYLGKREQLFTENTEEGLVYLVKMIEKLEGQGVVVLVYHHPVPFPVYNAYEREFEDYADRVDRALKHTQTKENIINLNHPSNKHFMKDLSHYIDHGHLSTKGQEKIIRRLDAELKKIGIK